MKIIDLITIPIGLTLIGIVLTASFHREKSASASDAAPAVHPRRVETTEDQDRTIGPIRNLRFTLFDSGIRPSEMRIKAGLVTVLIEDRTKLAQGVTVQRVLATERVAVTTIQKALDQSRGRNSFRLLPGEYELFDPNRSANKAVLFVEP